MKTIDITPTWSGLLPAMLEVIRQGSDNPGYKNVARELERMALAADMWVEHSKREDGATQ